MSSHFFKYISFGLLAGMLVVLALTTLLEKVLGREFAMEQIYHAWWFVIVWGVLCIASCIYLMGRKLYKKPAVFLLHASFVIILTGAFVSYTTGEKGYIHLRQGKPLNAYTTEDGATQRALPFEIKLVLFEIEYHPGTDQPANYISFFKINEEMAMVAMNKIQVYKNYRLCQLSYDSDEMGSMLLVNHDPWGIGLSYSGYLLLALAMIWLLWKRIGWKGLLCILLPLAGLGYYISQVNPMTPILRTPLLAVHVSVILLAYLLFLIISVLSIIGLSSKKRSHSLYCRSNQLLYPALFLLAAGIFIGAVWANISWGRYWGWDAKETWALITLIVYAFPMHKKSFPQLAVPQVFHRYCLIAFLAVLMTFLGVSFLLGGIHSYL